MTKAFCSKRFTLIIAVILFVLLLSGCVSGGDGSSSNSAEPPKAADDPADSSKSDEILTNEGSVSTTGDVLGIIVYNGSVYRQVDSVFCDAEQKQSYCGEFLGTALMNIPSSCFDTPLTLEDILKEYPDDFSSNIPGDIYSASGYETTERLCIPELYEGCDFIMFYQKAA